MPHFVFVWTMGDVFSLFILVLIAIAVLLMFVALAYEKMRHKIGRWLSSSRWLSK